jgi:uncharacterized membrane protein SirB2
MDQRKRIESLTQKTIIMFGAMLLQTAVSCIALWHVGKFWEQARWTAAETGICSVTFFITGLMLLSRIRKQSLEGLD